MLDVFVNTMENACGDEYKLNIQSHIEIHYKDG